MNKQQKLTKPTNTKKYNIINMGKITHMNKNYKNNKQQKIHKSTTIAKWSENKRTNTNINKNNKNILKQIQKENNNKT